MEKWFSYKWFQWPVKWIPVQLYGCLRHQFFSCIINFLLVFRGRLLCRTIYLFIFFNNYLSSERILKRVGGARLDMVMSSLPDEPESSLYTIWVLPSFTPRRFLTLLTWTFHVCIKQVTLIKKTVIRWKVGPSAYLWLTLLFIYFFFSHILFRRVHTSQSRKKYFVCVFLPKHCSHFWDFFFSLKFLSDQVPSTSTICSNMSSGGPCLASFANFMKHIYALCLYDIGLE